MFSFEFPTFEVSSFQNTKMRQFQYSIPYHKYPWILLYLTWRVHIQFVWRLIRSDEKKKDFSNFKNMHFKKLLSSALLSKLYYLHLIIILKVFHHMELILMHLFWNIHKKIFLLQKLYYASFVCSCLLDTHEVQINTVWMGKKIVRSVWHKINSYS